MGDEIDVMFEQWLKGYAQGKELPNEEYNKLRNCFRECAEMMRGKVKELEQIIKSKEAVIKLLQGGEDL